MEEEAEGGVDDADEDGRWSFLSLCAQGCITHPHSRDHVLSVIVPAFSFPVSPLTQLTGLGLLQPTQGKGIVIPARVRGSKGKASLDLSTQTTMTTTTGISSPAGGSEDPATAAAPETTTTMTATNEGSSPAPESGSATKKKRGAGDDWAKSKDDVENGDSDDMAEESTGSGEFRRADAETLSKRRIVKARRPPGMEGGGDGSPAAAAAAAAGGEDKPAVANPFAAISLTGAKPAAAAGGGGVFGSGFPKMTAASILGATGGGGGWGSTAAKEGDMVRPGTGPGLGSAPFGFAAYKLNPFQSAAPSAGTGASSSSFVSSPSKRKPPSELVAASEASSQSQFGKPATASQGGEDEEEGGGCGGGGSPLGGGEEDLEAEPNVTFDVPKVQGLKDASYKPLTGEEGETCVLQLRSKLYRLTEVKTKEGSAAGGGGGEGGGGGGGASSSSPAPRRDWVETGVGQAKVLVPQSRDGSSSAPARVVMRREPGTSVLINTLLKEPVGVAKHADKALRLTCLDEGGVPSTFLFRFKTTDEMEQMLGEIESQLAIAAGPGTEAGAGGEAAEGKEGEAEAV